MLLPSSRPLTLPSSMHSYYYPQYSLPPKNRFKTSLCYAITSFSHFFSSAMKRTSFRYPRFMKLIFMFFFPLVLMKTGDLLRSLHLLPKYFPPHFLVDSKCGYCEHPAPCQKAASRILQTFFHSSVRKDTDWDLIDDYAENRTLFSPLAIAIDSITVTLSATDDTDLRSR